MSCVGKLFNFEKFIAQSAVETLCDTVLPWTARLNLQSLNTELTKPLTHRFGNELWAVIATYMFRHAIHRKQLRQTVDNVSRFESSRHVQRNATTSKFIDDYEPLQRLATLGSIEDKIPTPDMVCMRRPMTMACVCTLP